jgi:preprotein translocase subunit YajC
MPMPSAQQYLYYGFIILLLVLFYFLLIHPQRKREKADKAMRDSIMTGDRICTIGGIIGRVVAVTEETITIETTNNRTRLKMYKWAIRNKIEKEDLAKDSKSKAKDSKESENNEEEK